MDQNLKLSKYERKELNNPGTYRGLIGRLLYLTITRPNITFAIHRLSQFMAKTRLPIYKLPIEFCNTSRALLVRVCYFQVSQSFTSKPLLMQTGLHAPILEDQPQDIVSLLGIPQFPGSLRSNKLCLGHLQCQNIGQWPWQCVRLCGCEASLKIFKCLILKMPCFLVTVKQHCIIGLILRSMRGQNTLKQIATLSGIKFRPK